MPTINALLVKIPATATIEYKTLQANIPKNTKAVCITKIPLPGVKNLHIYKTVNIAGVAAPLEAAIFMNSFFLRKSV